MDFQNFDQWTSEFDFEQFVFNQSPVINQNTATMAPVMSASPGTYSIREPNDGWGYTYPPPYEQDFEIPNSFSYASQPQGYDTICPEQLMWPSNNAQTQELMVDSPRDDYSMPMISTIDPYTENFPLSYETLESQRQAYSLGSLMDDSSPDVLQASRKDGRKKKTKTKKPKLTQRFRYCKSKTCPGQNISVSLSAPLSELAQHATYIPVPDMAAHVSRGAEERRKDSVEGDRVKKPANGFLLYCLTFKLLIDELIKLGFILNDGTLHLAMYRGKICGKSWKMESSEVRGKFNQWATIDKQNHSLAFPDYQYRFRPKKPSIEAVSISRNPTPHATRSIQMIIDVDTQS
ncbi:hypothetical protein F4781DRAFT_427949 [Annulohypoxylon bovei var. microspora]|nr:hypothetical protein F4781DRAFT_427949 [Annulohypoxylon bovei var. microspora]